MDVSLPRKLDPGTFADRFRFNSDWDPGKIDRESVRSGNGARRAEGPFLRRRSISSFQMNAGPGGSRDPANLRLCPDVNTQRRAKCVAQPRWRAKIRQKRPMFIDEKMWPGKLLDPRSRDLRGRWGRKRKVAVRAFVQGLYQYISGGSKRRGDLTVRDAGPTHNIDRSAEQMIAVWHSSDLAVVGNRAERARDYSKCCSDLVRRNRDIAERGRCIRICYQRPHR